MTAIPGTHTLRHVIAAALLGVAVAAGLAAPGELGFVRSITAGLVAHFERLFGQGARGRLEGWRQFVRSTSDLAGPLRHDADVGDRLHPVNGFFNRVPSVTDASHWGAVDYWATPAELMASNGGDCEDYAIAKYFALKEMGVPVARLRLIYARTWRANATHMVLAYYPAPGAEPLIMDNLESGIRPASDRPDLIPVYLFNDDDLPLAQNGVTAVRYDAYSIRKWREVLEKLRRELTY